MSAGADRRPGLHQLSRLLPTPRASDTGTAGRRAGAGFRPPLSQVVLLPTPRATDGTKGCPGQRGSSGDLTLPSAAVRVPPAGPLAEPSAWSTWCTVDTTTGLGRLDEQRWGGYAAAVARWEVLLGRAVPDPTQPGQHGRPVLAPLFVEWLMGLDHGWVTDLVLPRTGALRVLGNGVVWQQAATALQLLLCTARWRLE